MANNRPDRPKMLQAKDQQIAALREWYLSFSDSDREMLYSWVQSIAAIKMPPFPLVAFVAIKLLCDANSNLSEFGPKELCRAFEEWNKDSVYTPDGRPDS